jgi:hypothetical protein
MTPEQKQALLSVLRSILIAVGAYAVGKGWLTESVVAEAVPALIVVLTAAWGAVEKLNQPKRDPQ